MKSKFVRRLLAAGLTLALCLGLMATNVFAAGTVNEAVEINPSGGAKNDGQIVVTVYNQNPGTAASTGAQVTEGLSNPVKGVSINALRIGSVVELTSTDKNNTVSTQVAFGLDTTICEKLGLDTDTAIASKDVSGTITYYFAPTAVQDALKTANEAQSSATVTQATIEAYVERQAGNKKNAVTDEDGVATFGDPDTQNGLQYGLYLLAKSSLPSNATTDLVPFLVSVPMYVEGTAGTTGLWNKTVYAYPKVRAAEITIAKTVDDNDSKDYTDDDDKYVNAGQTLNFTVTTTIPKAETATGTGAANNFESFVITDTNAGSTLKINQNSVIVKLGTTELKETDNDYRSEYTGGVLTITLESAGLAKINAGLGNEQTLTVTYKATVATDVTFSSELTNTANLSYKREGMSSADTSKTSTVNLYTYGIDLTKTLSDKTDSITANTIKFELYNNPACVEEHKIPVVQGTGSSNGYWQAASTESNSTMNVGTDGKLNLYGLEPGTYYLKETATMSGYALLDEPIAISISAVAGAPGTAPTVTATVNGADAKVNNGVVSLAVENTLLTAGFKLPQTGGAGTLAVTAIGLGLLCVGIILLVVYRKKGSKNS